MNGLEFLLPIGVMAIFFGSIIALVKNVSESRLKNRLIKNGVGPELTKHLLMNRKKNEINALKYGIVMVGIGVALAIGTIIGNQMFTGALMLVLAGFGLVVVYAVSLRNQNQNATNL